ncbi:glutamate--cysteine ligase [Streptomyces griseorubiginosus]|uniref:carboxylate-amine ligase n=1 Tax=Streptomyces griseorubiginosus TaxID=67304 RepID=UPI002E821867|nr:glutamate--cysteine ligase [Streptomyces griseorubiginosus]WUB49543.1 glutamate--cysteine ligase [Streptomyces griseorubiginosus]WUB58072.1 glutamate--cysteine ligase [Streptomyces griseorubiginosus]
MRIGVEEEFHILEVESGLLVPRADAVLRRLPRRTFTTELHQSTVESNSGVHASLAGLYSDLSRTRRRLDAAASSLGLAVVAAGTAPLAPAVSGHPTADARYHHMVEEYRRVADEQLICGAQVHVDIPDRDTAVGVMCAISPWLPALLALSASSPFWQGTDTGYASWRTLLWQRWPTAGPVGCFRSAADYDAAVGDLVRTGVISDPGMIYYDVRPSAHLRTLELRICDACPRVETVVLVAGLFRALVSEALELRAAGAASCDGRHEWLRGASWRAARSGPEGALVDPRTHQEAPAADVVRALLARLRPALEAHGDWETVRDLTEAALAEGSAAERMRRKAREEDLLACTDLLIAETRGERRHRRPASVVRRKVRRLAPGRAGSGAPEVLGS